MQDDMAAGPGRAGQRARRGDRRRRDGQAITASGNGDIVGIEIEPEAVDPDDVEMLQDMVLAAVTEAFRARPRALQQKRMGAITGGLGGCQAC